MEVDYTYREKEFRKTRIFDSYACTSFMALFTAIVLCTRYLDSVLSVSVRRAPVVFSTVGFRGERHPEILALLTGFEPNPSVHRLAASPIELPVLFMNNHSLADPLFFFFLQTISKRTREITVSTCGRCRSTVK